MAQTITLSALSIEPRYFTGGDTVTVTMTIKNNSSSYSIDLLNPNLRLRSQRDSGGTQVLKQISLVSWKAESVTLAKGKTGTFTFTGLCTDKVLTNYSTVTELMDYMNSAGIRCIDSDEMSFGVSAYFSNGDTDAATSYYADLTAKLGAAIGVLDRHLPGAIARVNLTRCKSTGTGYVEDDEGTTIRSDIAFSLGEGFTGSTVPTKQINVTGDGGTSAVIQLTAAQLDAMISAAGYTETGAGGLIPGAYSNGENVAFQFVIGDAYETLTFTSTVARAFANVHMSGHRTGGVAFGKFSSSSLNNPLFECEYPALFTGGIEALQVDWITLTPASGVTTPNENFYGGGALKAGKVGSHVYIRGSVLAKSGATLATLPTGYRPFDGNHYRLAACGGSRLARLYVNPSGELHLEWVRNLSDGNAYTTAVWVDCSMDFWAYPEEANE